MTRVGSMKLYIDAMPLADIQMSGIGHLTLELTKALSRQNSVELVLVVPMGKKRLVERHGIAASIRTIPLPARAVSLLLRTRMLPPLDTILGRGMYLFPNYRNWPLIRSQSMTFIHDASFALHPETLAPKNLKYLQHNVATWAKRTNLILTLTQSSRNDVLIALGLDEQKVRVINCGVDANAFKKVSQDEVAVVKNKYGIASSKYLLYVGNFEPRKNINALLGAYAKLPKRTRDEYALLLVGGGGWLNEGTVQLIKEMQAQGCNIIRPKKYIEDADLPAMYSGASLLVHPALYEGFGLSLLQAMACELPVIAGSNSSIPEVVGDAGILVDITNEYDMSDKILQVLGDRRLQARMRKKGLLQSRKFTWDRAAEEVVECIDDITRSKE